MKFKLIKNKYELSKYFEIRKKIIDFYNPKNNKDFIYIDNLSHIYINMKFMGCKYNVKTEKIINNIIAKMNSKYRNDKNNNKIKNNKNNKKDKLINKVKSKHVKVLKHKK